MLCGAVAVAVRSALRPRGCVVLQHAMQVRVQCSAAQRADSCLASQIAFLVFFVGVSDEWLEDTDT